MLCNLDLKTFLEVAMSCDPALQGWGRGLLVVTLLCILAATASKLVQSGLRGILAAVFLMLSAVLFETAAHQPRLVWPAESRAETEAGHLVLIVDGSESVWRNATSARASLGAFAKDAANLVSEQAQTKTPLRWTVDILRFGSGVETLGRDQPADNLASIVASAEPPNPSSASNAAPAIDLALENIRKKASAGAIALFSDGHFETPVPQRLLSEAQAMGVPIYVFATGSRTPGAGLVAADIGPDHQVGATAILRGTVLGSGRVTASNGLDESSVAVPDSDVLTPVRTSTHFKARGLQYASLRFEGAGVSQLRRLYTLVRGPARVLVFGSAPWADMLPQDRWHVTRANPQSPPSLEEFDVVVVDSLPPQAFPSGFDKTLLEASAGTGLFLVNGAMRGSEEDPQLISDWNATDISPILPVDSDPRKFILDPPRRDVVIMIDVSGSMADSLDRATLAASTLLDQLRPKDTIAILTFAGTTGRQFTRRKATAQALGDALNFLGTLRASGGTNVNDTLGKAANLRTNYCAYFFISDGYFDAPQISPLCFPTAISTTGDRFEEGVIKWQDHISITNRSKAANLRLKFFEPEERTRHFRQGWFRPTSDLADPAMTQHDVSGIAIAYPRVDAEVLSFHEDLPADPVLALRRDAVNLGVATAVFLGEIPPDYAASSEQAVEVGAVLDRLTGWNRLDRFDVSITPEGERLIVSVTVLQDLQTNAPLPDQLSGSILSSNGFASGLSFRRSGARGQFVAEARFVAQETRSRGLLVLKEPGQAEQTIPLFLPPKSTESKAQTQKELFSFGINADELRSLATKSGGEALQEANLIYSPDGKSERSHDICQWLIAIALLSLMGSLWLQKRRST
jgi:hypothetical protein